MLTLDNFETQVSSVIVQRGKTYFNNGQVISLEETNDNTWKAEVEGSDIYSVEVTLENKTEITDYFCDCPFDGDGACKHAIAVFFALQNQINKQKNKPEQSRKKDVFENLLLSISLTEYQDFIRTFSIKNKNFKTEFELFFAGKDNRIDVEKKYAELINKLIKKHSDRGFIDYRSSSALSREIDKLLATGFSYIGKHNFKDAFALAKAVLKPMIKAIADADDSNGSIGSSIDKAITLLETIAASEAAIDIKEQVFQFLQTEMNDNLYFDYGDFGYDMFSIFQSLAVHLYNRDAFLHFVDAQLTGRKNKDDDDLKEYFQKKKIEFLQVTGEVEEAQKLIQQSMDIVEVRVEEVNKLLQAKDFDAAKKLITEGISIAEKKNHTGTVADWQKALLQIAFTEKDTPVIRHYTQHFAFDHGFSADYYKQWKATYLPAEWTTIIEKQIAEMMHKVTQEWNTERYWKPAFPPFLYRLAPVYIMEKMWDRLLVLVQQEKNLDTVLKYHPYLADKYPEELLMIYLPALETYGMNADTRSKYVNLVEMMKLILKDIPAGKEKILSLAKKLKEQFSVKPRRPAMIEELNKIL